MPIKTAISKLQEYAAIRHLPLPNYADMGRADDGIRFACFCDFNQQHQAIGYGSTKKAAKHDSAQKILDRLLEDKQINNTIRLLEETMTNVDKLTIQKNHVGELNEIASKYQLPYPTYNLINEFTTINGNFITECVFNNKFKTIGHGSNKKDSKQDAAKNMLEIVKNNLNQLEQTIVNKKQNCQIDDCDFARISEIYKNVSVNQQTSTKKIVSNNVEAAPEIQISDSIEELKSELKKYNVSYKLSDYQRNPWIIVFQADDTNFTLIGHGVTRNEAITDVLKLAVTVKKHGLSICTTSLM